MNQALLSSENMNFRTPPEFLKLLEPFGGIQLDPSSDGDNPTEAQYYCTQYGTFEEPQQVKVDNAHGLLADWTIYGGLTFSNPPYGRNLAKWSKKFVFEGERGCELLTLTPARIDTKWFKRMRKSASAVCLLEGRIKFWSQAPEAARGIYEGLIPGQWLPGAWNKKKQVWSNAAAPFPCATMYWGDRVDVFREVFQDRGWVIER